MAASPQDLLQAYRTTHTDAKAYLNTACEYLHQHKYLHNAPVISFFTLKLDTQVPDAWVAALDDLSQHELTRIVTNPDEFDMSTWPPALVALLQAGAALRSSRAPLAMKLDEFPAILHQLKGSTPKKNHESLRLAQLVAVLAENQECNTIVDVGAGSCYLGQLLRFVKPHLSYVGIEGNQSIRAGAQQRNQQLLEGKKGHVLDERQSFKASIWG
jgi:hypothetical protein